MGTYCALLQLICFCSVMRKTSCCLFQMITNLKLLMHSILVLDNLLNIDNNFCDSIVNNI